MMKKIILISTLLHLTFTLLAKDETDSLGIGEYVAKFHVTYTERNILLPINVKISSYLCLNSNLNSTTCEYDVTEEKFPGEYHCSWLSI